MHNHKKITNYLNWYRKTQQTLGAYTDWFNKHNEIAPEWSESKINKQLDIFAHQPLNSFCITVTGSLVSGKTHLINQVINSSEAKQEEFPVLSNEVDDFPVLNSTSINIPALNQEMSSTTAVLAEDITFNFATDLLHNNITPVMLTYKKDVAAGFYFLKNATYKKDVKLVDIINSIGTHSFIEKFWQTQAYQNQQELDKLSEYINIREHIPTDIAENYGFDTDWLPFEDDKVIVPKWRMVVINVPNNVLENQLSVIDIPANDGIYQHKADIQNLLQLASVNFHVMNCASKISKGDAKVLRKAELFKTAKLNQIVLLNNKKSQNLTEILTNSWQVLPENIHETSINIIESISNIISLCQKNIYQDILEPISTQALIQSQNMSDSVSTYESTLVEHAKNLEQLRSQKIKIEDKYKQTQQKVAAFEQLLSQSEASKFHEYILSVLNEEHFQKFSIRARSLIKDNTPENEIVTALENAKNIMISGLKLDLKRCKDCITKLNNSVRALYKDLNNNIEHTDYQLVNLEHVITELEDSTVGYQGNVMVSFDMYIYTPLHDAYKRDISALIDWYKMAIVQLQDPLKASQRQQDIVVQHLNEANQAVHDETVFIGTVHAKSHHAQAAAKDLLDTLQTLNQLCSEQI